MKVNINTIIDLRHELHRYPELSMKEYESQARRSLSGRRWTLFP